MSLQSETDVVVARLSGWSTPIDLVEFNLPGYEKDDLPETFIRPVIRTPPEAAEREELGPTASRIQDGTLIVQVFIGADRGLSELWPLTVALEALFRDYEDSGIQFEEPTSKLVGRSPDSPHYQANTEVPFYRQRVLTTS